MLAGDIIRNKNFTWSANINWAFNRNILEDIHGANIASWDLDNYVEGKPVGTIKGYRVVKIIESKETVKALNAASPNQFYDEPSLGVGDYMFKDLNNDGHITVEDREVIGTTEPKYFGGFSNTFTYKNFSLSAFFQYSVGAETIWSILGSQGSNSLLENKLENYATDTWTPINKDARYARAIYNNPSSNSRTSDRFLFDNSYLRLTSIQVAYNFNQALLEKISVSNAKVFISGSNLFTWTKWPGTDPGASSSNTNITYNTSNTDPYPLSTSFSIGIQIQF